MRIFSVLTACAGLLAACAPISSPLSGTSSGGEGKTIAVSVSAGSGAPRAGALVSLYRVFDDSGTYYPLAASKATDSKGKAVFSNVKPDVYCLASATADSSQMAITRRLYVSGDDTDTIRSAQSLKATGTISGVVSVATTQELFIRINETPFAARCAPGSGYSFRLPADSFVVRSVVRNAKENVQCVAATEPITVVQNKNTTVDTLRPAQVTRTADTFVIDDFEDGNFITNFGQWWWTFTDSAGGGHSRCTSRIAPNTLPDTPGAAGTRYSLRVNFQFGTSGPIYVGCGFHARRNGDGTLGAVDLSSAKALTFYGKATAGHLIVQVVSLITPRWIEMDIQAPDTAWRQYRLDLTAPDSGAIPKTERLRFVGIIRFLDLARVPGEVGEFWIDEVRLEY